MHEVAEGQDQCGAGGGSDGAGEAQPRLAADNIVEVSGVGYGEDCWRGLMGLRDQAHVELLGLRILLLYVFVGIQKTTFI